ncbi:MAG: hypothetical protein AB7G11_04475 [Phycisphaerales bacterium]
MKKARLFGLALVGVAALMVGCANDEASTCTDSGCSAEKASCSEGSGCCKEKAASECCKEKAASTNN